MNKKEQIIEILRKHDVSLSPDNNNLIEDLLILLEEVHRDGISKGRG